MYRLSESQQVENGKEIRTMCDDFDRYEEKGRNEGRREGENEMLKKLITRNVEKGCSLKQIAEALEHSEEELKPIYDMVLEEQGCVKR
jgi:predicted transposase/invertase (TIGR01784 family)